jgi:hypothetical protein
MSSAAVEAAFQARYYEYTLNDPPIFPAIMSGQPDNTLSAFVILQYPVANGSKPVLSRHYFEEGAARFVLNVRRSVEMSTALGLADDLAAIFRDRKFHDIETFTPSPPIVNDVTNDGNWFSLSVIVPYRYQFYDDD